MPILIEPYTQEFEKAVKRFNNRLSRQNVLFSFPESCMPPWLTKDNNKKLYQEMFVAKEEGELRGGYILKHQDFYLNGQIVSIGNYGLPLSEGIIDPSYNHIGIKLINDALRRQSLLYALGMGGIDRPLPKMLKALGWRIFPVPFYFWVNRPYNFLRNIRVLRNNWYKKLASDFLAFSGIGSTLIKLRQGIGNRFSNENCTFEEFAEIDSWSDNLWQENKNSCSMSAVRDSDALATLYPVFDKRFHRIVVSINGDNVGWSVLLDTQMKDDKHFNYLRVGAIVDCFCKTGFEEHIIVASKQFLTALNIDLVISNQLHQSWRQALVKNGFINGPSNFVLATSPELTNLIAKVDPNFEKIHINRGDGDGPINL